MTVGRRFAVSNIAWDRHDDPEVLALLRAHGVTGIEVAPPKVWPGWDGATPEAVKQLDSWFDLGDFRPLTHVRRTTKDGQTKVEGFAFQPDRIVGLKDLPDNVQAAYDVASPQPTFNFETDMEFLQALPLAAGYEAQIVFHHPGGAPPAPYLFKVTGSETLTSSAGGKVDCWVVTTDYNHPEWKPASFWLAKDSQVVLKVVSPAPDGSVWVKTLIW